jgi:hypothetical protein
MAAAVLEECVDDQQHRARRVRQPALPVELMAVRLPLTALRVDDPNDVS